MHAKIRHPLYARHFPLYARPFPGYPISTPGKFLRILVALYGLRQSAYEFYILIMSLLLEFGMVRCEIDHGVFFGDWVTSPDLSIAMPLGPCTKFPNILIVRDRSGCCLWLSSWLYVSELLDEWNLATCLSSSTPFPSHSLDLLSAPPNSLPSITDADLLPQYQRLVGCLLYLAVMTPPDISYYAMWLGQFNATPTHGHFLLAKHSLRYALMSS